MRASRFPDPRSGPGDGPLALGGDLQPATLLDAYANGIFPWPAPDTTLFWWSPDPRAVLPLDRFHISKSLRRTLRSGRFTVSRDAAFPAVVDGCANRREGTWITPGMAAAYTRLHRLGHAHSVEVWDTAGALVGGVYGVTLGGAFMGESMFHRVTDASKVALAHLVAHLREQGFTLFDVQLPTAHLGSLGAVTVARDDYLSALAAARNHTAVFAATPAGTRETATDRRGAPR